MGAQDSAGLAPSPNLKNTNFAPTVLSIFWVECSIVVAVLVGRFHARRLLRAVSFDDWFMFFSGVSNWPQLMRNQADVSIRVVKVASTWLEWNRIMDRAS